MNLYRDAETGRMAKPGQCVRGTVLAEYLYIPSTGEPTTAAIPRSCSRCEGYGCDCPTLPASLVVYTDPDEPDDIDGH